MKKTSYIILLIGLVLFGCRKKIEVTPGEHQNNYSSSKNFEIVHIDFFENKAAIKNLFAFNNKLYITTNKDFDGQSAITVLNEDNSLIIPKKNISNAYIDDFSNYDFNLIEDAEEKDGIIYFGGLLNYNDDDYFYLEYNTADNSLNEGNNLINTNADGVKSLMTHLGEVVAYTEGYNNDFNCLSCPTNYGPYPHIINVNMYDATSINDTFYIQSPTGKVYYTNTPFSTSFVGVGMALTDTVVRMFEYKNTLCAIGSFDNGTSSLVQLKNGQLETMATNSDIVAYLSENFGPSTSNQYNTRKVPKVRVINDDIYIMGEMYIKNSLGNYTYEHVTLRYQNGSLDVIDTDLKITDIAMINNYLYGAIFEGSYLAKLTF